MKAVIGVSILAAAQAQPSPEIGITLPMGRIAKQVSGEAQADSVSSLLAKYSHILRRDSLTSGQTSQLQSVVGAAFFAQITLGTPPQPFTVLCDTGSSVLWIPASNCTTCAQSSRHFQAAQSSTYSEISGTETVLKYGTGAVEGRNSTDTFGLGALSVPNQDFLVIDAEDSIMRQLLNGTGDGIMGMAFQGGLGSGAVHDSPIYSLATQNLLPNNIFTIWMNQTSQFNADGIDRYGGKLVLGAADPTLYTGSFTFIPVTPINVAGRSVSYYWSVTPQSISAGAGLITPQPNTAVFIDSGTSLLLLDATTFQSLMMQFIAVIGNQLALNQRNQIYEFSSCAAAAKLPDITFALGPAGSQFPLSATDYVGFDGDTLATSKNCVLAIQSSGGAAGAGAAMTQGPPIWILGDVFMTKYYTLFDVERGQIGFALASNGATIGNGAVLTMNQLTAGGGSGFGGVAGVATAKKTSGVMKDMDVMFGLLLVSVIIAF